MNYRLALITLLIVLVAPPSLAQPPRALPADVRQIIVHRAEPANVLELQESYRTVSLVCRIGAERLEDCAASQQVSPVFMAEAIAGAQAVTFSSQELVGGLEQGREVRVLVRFDNLQHPMADFSEFGAPSPVPMIRNPNWVQRPTATDFETFYPPGARGAGVQGNVSLDCAVSTEGALDCHVTSEEPAGWGFGEAAVQISRRFLMNPAAVDGHPVGGGRYLFRIPFRMSAN